jgi:hypothetical protein
MKSPIRLDSFGVSGERVKNSTLRILGVIAAIVLVATVGFIAAQVVQSPTRSQIPTIVTGRPLGSAVATPTGVAPANPTTPASSTTSAHALDRHEESHDGLNPEIVTPSVRDNDKHHHDED